MKKKKSILHLCEATFLMLLLILASALYLLKYLQTPDISYVPMLHLIQLILALVVFTLALTLIQRELLLPCSHEFTNSRAPSKGYCKLSFAIYPFS